MSDQPFPLDVTIAGLTSHQSQISGLEALFQEPETVEVRQKFLRYRLCSEQVALLPAKEISAVLTVEAREVLRVPHMPDCVLGIYNWRGEVLWLVDLASQVGFDSLGEQDQRLTSFMAIVIQVNGQSLGLAVPEVYDLEQFDPHLLQLPLRELFLPRLLPFVKGYFTGDSQHPAGDQRSTVLDVLAILQDARLRVHESKS